MVSKYDIFFIVASRGTTSIAQILEELHKQKNEYQIIFNHILALEHEKLVMRKEKIMIVHSKRSETLFNLLSFCVRNGINYNLLFKKEMLLFLALASRQEFFTIKHIRIHSQTFQIYTKALSSYGFLLILSRKPLKCKLLRHHFLTELAAFFGKKILFYPQKRHSVVREIEKELRTYRKNLRVHAVRLQQIEQQRETNFIYAIICTI